MVKVRALKRLFYENRLRRVGDVFELASVTHLCATTMVRVADDEPERHTSAQQLLTAERWRQNGMGPLRRVCEPVPPAREFDPFE